VPLLDAGSGDHTLSCKILVARAPFANQEFSTNWLLSLFQDCYLRIVLPPKSEMAFCIIPFLIVFKGLLLAQKIRQRTNELCKF